MNVMHNHRSSHRQERDTRDGSNNDDADRRRKKRNDENCERKSRDNNKGEMKNECSDDFANNRSSDANEGNGFRNTNFGYSNRGRRYHSQRGGRGSSFRQDNGRGGQRFFGFGGRNAGYDGGHRRGGSSFRGGRVDRYFDIGNVRFGRGNRQRDFDSQQRRGWSNREENRLRDESPKPVMKLIDPAAVPRSGRYFEHDSRDALFSGRDRDDRDRRNKRMYDPRADYSSQRRDANRKRLAPTGWRNQPFGLDDSKKSRNAGYKDEDYRTGGRPCSDVDGVWTHDKFEEVMREENVNSEVIS